MKCKKRIKILSRKLTDLEETVFRISRNLSIEELKVIDLENELRELKLTLVKTYKVCL